MIVKIKCTCNTTFEIKDGCQHPKDIICPNCGTPLPSNASEDLFSAFQSFSLFETKLDHDGYEVIIISD